MKRVKRTHDADILTDRDRTILLPQPPNNIFRSTYTTAILSHPPTLHSSVRQLVCGLSETYYEVHGVIAQRLGFIRCTAYIHSVLPSSFPQIMCSNETTWAVVIICLPDVCNRTHFLLAFQSILSSFPCDGLFARISFLRYILCLFDAMVSYYAIQAMVCKLIPPEEQVLPTI